MQTDMFRFSWLVVIAWLVFWLACLAGLFAVGVHFVMKWW